MRPFIVFTQPFCEAGWLGALLSYKQYTALVDMSLALRAISDLDLLLARPNVGYIDTNLALLWPEVIDRVPQAKLVVLRRPIESIIAQGAKHGMEENDAGLKRLDIALNEVSGLSGTLCMNYAELAGEIGLRKLFEFCLPARWDRAWFDFCSDLRDEECVPNNALLAQQNLDGITNTFGRAVCYYDMRLREQAHVA